MLRRLMASLSALLLAATVAAQNWPQFRGPQASGIADGQHPPTTWDAEKGINVRWKTPIPGLGHSSPIVWGDRVFVTTAVGDSDAEPTLRVGLYGESPDNPERFVHHYRVYCLDKQTGNVLWEQTACSGIPKVKRHIKSSHANPTPATDGRHLVVSFGSEGLYCYDLEGKLEWRQDLGLLDSGAFDAKEIQWGFGSSPVIHADRVIVQCDANNQAFLAAFDLRDGRQIWRTARDDVPTWGTPTVHPGRDCTQIIVNGYKHIGGYDAGTGNEQWHLRGGGDIPVPTPVVAHDLVFITNAHGPESPIYAIKLSATGDITLAEGQDSSNHVAWWRSRRGAYMPTPLVYGDYLYLGNDRGILTCYRAKTGEQVYRERIGDQGGAFTASPVAADGQLYYPSESGQVYVIKAGPSYELLATNPVGEYCLATPAISDGLLIVRTQKHVFGLGLPARTPREPY